MYPFVLGLATGLILLALARRLVREIVNARRFRETLNETRVLALEVSATRGDVVIDPVAGEIRPWPSGACREYVPDFRSNICVNCDWPSEEHGRGR